MREGWMNSYRKRQVLMFYPLGKNLENLMGGGGGECPPSLYVWGLSYGFNIGLDCN